MLVEPSGERGMDSRERELPVLVGDEVTRVRRERGIRETIPLFDHERRWTPSVVVDRGGSITAADEEARLRLPR